MGTNSRIIRRCASLPEAYVCWGLLRANGFDASIDNRHHAAQDWAMVQALGGIQIRIPTSQFDDAKACIIDAVETAITKHSDPVRMTVWNRAKAITMAFHYFGLLPLAIVCLLIWLHRVVPESWIPKFTTQDYYYWYELDSYVTAAPLGILGGLLILATTLFIFVCLWTLNKL